MATTYDNASLVMIPSGVKEDKLYSIKPTDGSGDFTFSRGSDIEATRVNSSGLIEKAKVNYILYSNTFNDSSWNTTDLNVTSGATDPNGGSTAWTIANTAANGIIQKAVSLTGLRSVSIYAKQGTHRYLRMGAYGGTSSYANFDLQDGVVSSGTKAVMESVGGGWYRCTAWGADGTTGGVQIYPSNNATSAPTTNGSILIWRAQLNHGLVAQDYVETTTTAVVEGLTADLPRLDYSGGASCPSLLLEPSRTNFIPHSEYFSDWALDGDGAGQSVTANYSVSPEGVQNAYRLQLDTTGGSYSRIRKSVTASYSGAGIFSVYLKTNDASTKTIRMRWSGSGDIQKTITGEWQRFDVQGTATSGLASDCEIFLDFADNDIVDLSMYGAVQEAGSYPTSYIPTYGTAANRGADSCKKIGAGVEGTIGQTEGTIFVDLVYNGSESQTGNIFAFNENTAGSVVIIRNSNGIVSTAVWDGSSNASITGGSMPIGQRTKIAYAYKSGSTALFVNGVQIGSDNTDTFSLPLLNEIHLNSSTAYFAFKQDASFNQTLLFKTRLTNAELAALTTI